MTDSQEATPEVPGRGLVAGFKAFLLQGDIIMIAVGLVIALAFSTLIKAFTDSIITPLVNAIGGGSTGLGFHVRGQLVDVGAFISALVYFAIFMAVIYFLIVVPYRAYQARRGVTVFGEPPPVKTCPGMPLAGPPRGGDQVPLLRDYRGLTRPGRVAPTASTDACPSRG